MNRKFSIFINEKGEKVAVDHNPIEGQLRYVESERTAIDGEKWWCIFDNWLNGYVWGYKYETKRQCRAAIAKFLREGRYLSQKYLNGAQEKKTKKHTAKSSISKKERSDGMKNTIYVVAEAQNIPDNGTVPYAYATVYSTEAAAKRGLRKMVKEIVQANYEGNDDIEASAINDEVNSIIKRGDGANWFWEANDRSAAWQILELDIAQSNHK